MPDPTPYDRRRYATWWLRVQIIVLGLAIGIGARSIKSAWQRAAVEKPDVPAEKNGESVAVPSPSPQPSPRSTEERE
jgi:hypothetical protein